MSHDYQDLQDRYEPLLRAVIRLVAAYDPADPDECSLLIQEAAIAAGCSGQLEAIHIVRGWGHPVHSGEPNPHRRSTLIPRGKEKSR